MWWNETFSPDLGDGSAATEKGPGLYDTREFPKINLEDGTHDAWAWDTCTIEMQLNKKRNELWMQELFDPECDTDSLEEYLEKGLEELS